MNDQINVKDWRIILKIKIVYFGRKEIDSLILW